MPSIFDFVDPLEFMRRQRSLTMNEGPGEAGFAGQYRTPELPQSVVPPAVRTRGRAGAGAFQLSSEDLAKQAAYHRRNPGAPDEADDLPEAKKHGLLGKILGYAGLMTPFTAIPAARHLQGIRADEAAPGQEYLRRVRSNIGDQLAYEQESELDLKRRKQGNDDVAARVAAMGAARGILAGDGMMGSAGPRDIYALAESIVSDMPEPEPPNVTFNPVERARSIKAGEVDEQTRGEEERLSRVEFPRMREQDRLTGNRQMGLLHEGQRLIGERQETAARLAAQLKRHDPSDPTYADKIMDDIRADPLTREDPRMRLSTLRSHLLAIQQQGIQLTPAAIARFRAEGDMLDNLIDQMDAVAARAQGSGQ